MRCATTLLLLGLVSGAHAPTPAAPADPNLERARAVLRRWPVLDGHNDAPWEIRERLKNKLAAFDFHDTKRLDKPMATDLTRAAAGGLGGQFWSVYVPVDYRGAAATQAVIEQIDVVRRLVARYPDRMTLALSADDVAKAFQQGKLASLIGIEGGYAINESLPTLRALYLLGARYMTLAHWETMSWVDAATDDPEHDGLSPFGVEVVREMNRLGMLIDLSHVSAATMNDVLDVSAAPVIFSHSSARALCGHPRNVPDDVLVRVAKNGGVVMVNFAPVFVSQAVFEQRCRRDAEEARLKSRYLGDPRQREEQLALWDKQNPTPAATLAQLADHIDHIKQIAGIDHVGIGSDLDGIPTTPTGLEDVSTYPALVAELLRRGYREEEVGKVASGNILRVLRRAEQVAVELGRTRLASEATIQELDKQTGKP